MLFEEKRADFIAADDSWERRLLAVRGRGFPPHLLLPDLMAQQTVEFETF